MLTISGLNQYYGGSAARNGGKLMPLPPVTPHGGKGTSC